MASEPTKTCTSCHVTILLAEFPLRNPLVSCILLSCGRERAAMKARAVFCFNSQTYANRELIVYEGPKNQTIGEMRNLAIAQSHGSILATWDEDEWYHPNRLSEQVALLQASGADLVGFNEALFWDSRVGLDTEYSRNEAWLYRNPIPTYALGTSFCLWRRTWEAHPFDAVNHGEDERLRVKVKSVGVSSLVDGEPRMICSIHGGNTSPFDPATSPQCCRRVPEWDAHCERVMNLEVRA